MSNCVQRARAGAVGLFLGALAGVVWPGAAALADARAGRVAVAPPSFEGSLRGVASGYADWARNALSQVGANLVTREETRRVSGAEAPRRDDVAALASALDAGFVLLSDARASQGQVTLRLALYAGASGALAAVAGAEGSVQAIGELARAAAAEIAEALRLRAADISGAPAPRLVDFAAATRAFDALDRGDLARAWREVDGRLSPMADRLRERIDALGRSAEVSDARRAQLWIAQGDVDRAMHLIRDALRSGRDSEVLIAAAQAAAARNDPRRAAELFGRALDLGSERAVAYLGLSRAFAAGRRIDEARAAAERAVELDPTDPAPLELLADLSAGDVERAARFALRAGQRAAARFETARAERNFKAAGRAASRRTGEAEATLAAHHAGLGSHAQAIRAYERAIEGGRSDAKTWRGLADARRASGDAPGAEAAYKRALGLAPRDADALRGLGELYAESGRIEQAVAPLERALEISPSDRALRRSLAGALHGAGDDDRALELLASAPGGEPDAADLRSAASIHEDRGDLAAAGKALTRAVALEPESPALREALADLHARSGDAEAAERERAAARRLRGADLGELSAGGLDDDGAPAAGGESAAPTAAARFEEILTTFPKRNPLTGRKIARVALAGVRLEVADREDRVWEWLSPRRMDLRRLEAALETALSGHFELVEPSAAVDVEDELEHLWSHRPDSASVAVVNALFETDAVFVARSFGRWVKLVDYTELLGSYQVELRMLAGGSQPAVTMLANSLVLPDDAGAVQWNPRALAIYAFVALLLALPLLRGWGTLLVNIEYTSDARSIFSIRVSKKPEKAKQGKSGRRTTNKLARFQRRLRFVGRYQRHMVGRETRFRWLPARTYYIAVHGLLQDPVNDDIVGNYFEEKTVVVRRGRTAPLAFDFRPKECSLEVSVVRSGQRERQATVALRGRLDSQRYARDGSAILYLAKGSYTIVVGGADRVAERDVTIETLEPHAVMFDLDDENALVFHDCPAAVTAYLQNDLEAAALALEAGGQAERAHQLRAEYYRTVGNHPKAAEHFEAAGQVFEAAEMRAGLSEHTRAAELYERAGDYARAAEMYRLGGDAARAGEAYESWGEFDAAIECFREAGDRAREAGLLEKTGRYFDAAELALAEGDMDAAIRNLQQIDGHQPEYGEGCQMLAKILADRQEYDLAIQKFEEAIAIAGDERAPLDTQEQFAELLTRAERFEAALEVYDRIRARDFQYPNAAERIAALKAKINERRTEPRGQSESRYEILGELGRGGMGIVHEARDRRLGRIVALKRLPDNLKNHPTAVQLFLREARAAAALNHPNIVTLFDAGEEDGVYFLTMERLEGHPLQKILERKGRLSARDVARLGMQAAAGLQFAHSRRIVHRDVKTANLFFTRDRVLKIMDFGLAKMLEEVRRATTVIGGTPYYMAPEQAAGEAVDHRADLYALGVTLFELSTGVVPFRKGDVIYHHRHTPAPDPRGPAPDLPDPIAELILALMAKDPAERPESASVVGQRLAAVPGVGP